MKAALGQINIIWEDKDANFSRVRAALDVLAGEGTELFLLPEMSLTGFSMHTERTKESGRETVARMQELAAEYGIAIGVGWAKDAGEKCENRYTIVSPEGEILDYAKLHPFGFGFEPKFFRGGNELPCCSYGGFGIGVQICYDLRFPEPFQILARQAGFFIVPANWPAVRREAWGCLLRARAMETQGYVAGINCAGKVGKLYYSGDSVLYDPEGNALQAKALDVPWPERCPEEKLLLYEFYDDTKKYRESFPVQADRREELYGRFFQAPD
ncbi:MAG: carbon-nitrogen family hydrolase [Lachnospiraceae bacterium]|nr:carbon-nitrogen family hydrolase [Lachnospiraceae bacterium]